MLHIAFFTKGPSDFDPNTGGVQRIVRLLQKELISRGYKVSLISGLPLSNKSKDVISLPNNHLNSPENIVYLKKIISEKGITHIINEDALDSDVINLMEKIRKNVKLISVHNNCIKCLEEHYENIFRSNRSKLFSKAVDLSNAWELVRFLFRLKMKRHWKKILKNSDAVVVYFEEFKKELQELVDVPENKVFTITNPNPFEVIQKDKINKRIIYIGRVEVNQKRVDKLMMLWKELHAELPDWKFDFIGDGSYMDQAKEFIEFHNLNRVTIHGWQDPLPFWDNADIFTITSDFEGYGMVLVEAQSRGVIPVSFKSYSAIHEVIQDNVSGILVDDFEIIMMKNAVVKLANNHDHIIKLRNGLSNNLSKFQLESIVDKWVGLMNKI
jgi:glycosyltransferase involved in cell wall biosynthesis